jgi:hypothetical protein
MKKAEFRKMAMAIIENFYDNLDKEGIDTSEYRKNLGI